MYNITYCYVFLRFPFSASTSQRCRFPRQWKGRWHQHGLGDVTIKTNSVTKNGRRLLCAGQGRDYFLVEDR